jgi:hypothetical protein
VYLTENYHVDYIKKNETDGAISTYRVEKACVQTLCGKPEGKTALGRARRRWDDIKVDLS